MILINIQRVFSECSFILQATFSTYRLSSEYAHPAHAFSLIAVPCDETITFLKLLLSKERRSVYIEEVRGESLRTLNAELESSTSIHFSKPKC